MPTPMKKGQWTHWVLSAATLLLAALLIANCYAIYQAGTAPENLTDAGVRIQPIYSREQAVESLKDISWAVVLWAAAWIAALQYPSATGKAGSPTDMRYKVISSRTLPNEAMLHERKKRRYANLACALVCILCGTVAGSYLLNPDHFHSRDLEPVMGAMLSAVLPSMIAALAALTFRSVYADKSMQREMEEAKSAEKIQSEKALEKKNYVPVLRLFLYAAAFLLVIQGIFNGGMRDVLVKAINICTECIGLG